MITIRPADKRGHTDLGWLDSWHSFSFGGYRDPQNMGFRNLRVINEDYIKPGAGFGMHPHSDMEILTYVKQGELEHRDSMGNGSVLRAGGIQRMSAGTGVRHSEFNHSDTETLHLFQIWIIPAQMGIQPGYEERHNPLGGGLELLASGSNESGAMKIHQDVRFLKGKLNKGDDVAYEILETRYAWVQVTEGRILLNDKELSAGDGAAISSENSLRFEALEDAEFLLFDLN